MDEMCDEKMYKILHHSSFFAQYIITSRTVAHGYFHVSTGHCHPSISRWPMVHDEPMQFGAHCMRSRMASINYYASNYIQHPLYRRYLAKMLHDPWTVVTATTKRVQLIRNMLHDKPKPCLVWSIRRDAWTEIPWSRKDIWIM